MEKKLLTVKQVMEVYGINKDYLYRFVREGLITKYKVNGTKFSVEELDKFVESRREIK
jgi:excisionase family DNA binding protein